LESPTENTVERDYVGAAQKLKTLDEWRASSADARVPGKGKDGGPNCGTVKPFDGWKVRSA
jgi:hypothetical protein